MFVGKAEDEKKKTSQRVLDEIRQSKQLGLTRAQQYELEEAKKDEEIYEEVDDEEYQKIVEKSAVTPRT